MSCIRVAKFYLCIHHLLTYWKSLEVISVSLHMSVITQDGDTAVMMAASEGMTEVISLLLEAGADFHLQNKVWMSMNC